MDGAGAAALIQGLAAWHGCRARWGSWRGWGWFGGHGGQSRQESRASCPSASGARVRFCSSFASRYITLVVSVALVALVRGSQHLADAAAFHRLSLVVRYRCAIEQEQREERRRYTEHPRPYGLLRLLFNTHNSSLARRTAVRAGRCSVADLCFAFPAFDECHRWFLSYQDSDGLSALSGPITNKRAFLRSRGMVRIASSSSVSSEMASASSSWLALSASLITFAVARRNES